MKAGFATKVSTVAILVVIAPQNAFAQQALPTIDVGAHRRPTSTVAHRPKQAAAPTRAANRTPIAVASPTNSGGQPSSNASGFVPAGQQILRGPIGVNGYFAAGTSTATKTQTRLLDLPQSVTILTQQQLQDRNSLTLNQALTYVPGVTVAQGEGQRDAITIRGQATSADFYTDNVRDDAEYYRDLYNIQSVEVLKGPSALIFGRGGGGGVVNRVTKKADGATVRNLQISTGSFGRKRVTVDIGGAINDEFAYRFNSLYEQSYNYRNFFSLEKWGVNPVVTWKPLEKTFVTVSYEHYRDGRVVDRGIPSLSPLAFSPKVLGKLNDIGATNFFTGYPAPTNSWTFFGNPDASHASTDVDRAVAFVDHTFDSGVNVKNQTVFANYAKYYSNAFANSSELLTSGECGPAGVPCVDIAGYNNETPRQNIFNQMDFTYKFFMFPQVSHELLAGWEVGNQKTDANRNEARFNNILTGPSTLRVNFLTPTIFNPVDFNRPNFRRHTDLDLVAGYLQDQIAITKYIDVIAGARFDSFNLKFVNNLGAINTSGLSAPTYDNYPGQVINNATNRVSPRFGLVLKPVDTLSFYGSYTRSFLPPAAAGGADQFSNFSILTAALQPQSFENVEGGFKMELNPALFLTGAIYSLKRNNVPVAATAFFNIITDTQTNGGEIALVGKATKEWEVSLGYSNQSAYITRTSRTPSGTRPLTEKGFAVPWVPRNTFTFWNKYDISDWLGYAPDAFGVGTGVVFNSSFYAAADNAVIVPGYARWDSAFYFKVSESITGQVNIENMLDANYYASAHNNNNIMPGSPRAAYLTMNAKF
jgi:catecholate siderophore receptor